MRIGVDSTLWTQDQFSDTKPIFSQCLAEASAVGYQGIAMGRQFPQLADKTLGSIGTYGLSLTSAWQYSLIRNNTVKEELLRLQQILKLLQRLACHTIILCEPAKPTKALPRSILGRSGFKLYDREQFLDKLCLLAECIWSEYGLRVSYYDQIEINLYSIETLDRLVTMTNDYVGILYDTGHLAYAGIDIFQVIQTYGTRINHVYLRDVQPAQRFEGASARECFTMPGEGAIDFATVLQYLQKINYQDWIVVAGGYTNAKTNPLIEAKKGHHTVHTVLENLEATL